MPKQAINTVAVYKAKDRLVRQTTNVDFIYIAALIILDKHFVLAPLTNENY